MIPFVLLFVATTIENALPHAAAPASAPTAAAQSPDPKKPDVPAPGERRWSGSVGLAVAMARGNTDTNNAGATVQVENRGHDDRWTGQLLWNYADEKGVGVTQRRTYGQLKYDDFVDPKTYVFGVASGESDFKAALDLRTTIGAGVGYQFREDERWKISGEAGLAWIDEDFTTTGDDRDYLAGRLAYKADATFEKWTVGQWGELFPSLEDGDDVSARVDTHARLNLTEKLFAQVQWIFAWDNTPASGADRLDDLYLLTFGWTF